MPNENSTSFIRPCRRWLNACFLLVIPLLLYAENMEADRNKIGQRYSEMYRCLIDKDTTALGRLLDDGFILVHMTGMRQPKAEYLRYIAQGTLNYYSCEDTQLDITFTQDNRALLIGRSRVSAAVFGGGRHTWRLQLDIDMKKENGRWLMTEARASTY